MIIFKIIILLGLVQLLYRIEKPFVCSGIYTGVIVIFGLISGYNIVLLGITAVVGSLLAALYFWLLNYYKHGFVHWVILIVGLPIGWFF